MKTPTYMLRQFHTEFGLPMADGDPGMDDDQTPGRAALVMQEFTTLFEALSGEAGAEEVAQALAHAAKRGTDPRSADVVAVAGGMAGLVYALYSMATSLGIDLDAAVREVHRSNMSRTDSMGRVNLRRNPGRSDASGYRSPDIAKALGIALK